VYKQVNEIKYLLKQWRQFFARNWIKTALDWCFVCVTCFDI